MTVFWGFCKGLNDIIKDRNQFLNNTDYQLKYAVE